MPRPSLDEIFGNATKPVMLMPQNPDAAVLSVYAPQDNRPGLDQIFARNEDNLGAPTIAPPQQQEAGILRTLLDQGLQGATFGFSDEITDRLGALGGSLYTGESYGDVLKDARSASKSRMQAQFEQNPGTSIGANVLGGLFTGGVGATTKAGTAVANSLRTGNAVARAGKGALAGAASGGLYGTGTADEGNRLKGAATGAAIGAALPVAIGAGGAAVKGSAGALTPTIQEGLQPVVELAQKYKIPVALHQVAEGNAIKNFQKVSKELPFSGEAKFRDKQLSAFNRQIVNTVGGNANKFTPELMDNLFTRVGKEFDNLGKGKNFDLSDDFLESAGSILDDAVNTGVPKDTIVGFEKFLNKVLDNTENGKIKGETLATFRKEANRLSRKTGNDEARSLYNDLENSIVDIMTVGDDAASGALSKAKQQYKNLLVIEPLTAKAKGGNISPSQLQTRVAKIYGRQFTRGKAGEIGDLARIGSELLSEIGGSDTTQKILYAGGAGSLGTAALLNPALAAGAAVKGAGILGANRMLQSTVNRNQKVVRAASNKTERIASSKAKRIK